MKLLSKSQIDAAKASDRSREVAEGMKLAQRVDSLRELRAEVEVELEKFRTQTLAKINEEISEKSALRDALAKEAKDYEERRRVALEPITEELARLEEKRREIDSERERIDDREHLCEDRERENSARASWIDLELRRVESIKTAESESLAKAAVALEKADSALKTAESVQRNAEKLKEEVTADLVHRDAVLAARERDCRMKEAQVEQRAKEQELKELQLEDQRLTLERAFKRLRK